MRTSVITKALLAATAIYAAGLPVPVDARIYRCDTADAGVLFSDLPCPDGSVRGDEVHGLGGPASGAQLLSAEERKQALRLDDRWRRDNERKNRTPSRSEPALHRARRRREVACESARAGLARLQAHRRSGYRLSEDRKLSREEGELVRRIQENC